jgi:hypothetical protein
VQFKSYWYHNNIITSAEMAILFLLFAGRRVSLP